MLMNDLIGDYQLRSMGGLSFLPLNMDSILDARTLHVRDDNSIDKVSPLVEPVLSSREPRGSVRPALEGVLILTTAYLFLAVGLGAIHACTDTASNEGCPRL